MWSNTWAIKVTGTEKNNSGKLTAKSITYNM